MIEPLADDQPGRREQIGIVAPYAKDFCTTRNRLRVSARGKLHLCLLGAHGIDLKPLQQADDQLGEARVYAAVPLV